MKELKEFELMNIEGGRSVHFPPGQGEGWVAPEWLKKIWEFNSKPWKFLTKK